MKVHILFLDHFNQIFFLIKDYPCMLKEISKKIPKEMDSITNVEISPDLIIELKSGESIIYLDKYNTLYKSMIKSESEYPINPFTRQRLPIEDENEVLKCGKDRKLIVRINKKNETCIITPHKLDLIYGKEQEDSLFPESSAILRCTKDESSKTTSSILFCGSRLDSDIKTYDPPNISNIKTFKQILENGGNDRNEVEVLIDSFDEVGHIISMISYLLDNSFKRIGKIDCLPLDTMTSLYTFPLEKEICEIINQNTTILITDNDCDYYNIRSKMGKYSKINSNDNEWNNINDIIIDDDRSNTDLVKMVNSSKNDNILSSPSMQCDVNMIVIPASNISPNTSPNISPINNNVSSNAKSNYRHIYKKHQNFELNPYLHCPT